MKWNGAHDESFFRCFEQYLDAAIAKFKGRGEQAQEMLEAIGRKDSRGTRSSS